MKTRHRKSNDLFRLTAVIVLLAFGAGVVPGPALAQGVFMLPPPGMMVAVTPGYVPVMIRGLTVHPDDPLKFNFIIDTGHSGLALDSAEFRQESETLVKYFLAALTLPEQDLWVNLSPYEQDRIVSDSLGRTEMGRDLLAQDYLLKQLTATMMYPEKELGQEFWQRVHRKAYEKYGTTDIPVNTFNKVWIVPDRGVVYEQGQTAFVIERHLKVMLERDYAAQQHSRNIEHRTWNIESVSLPGPEVSLPGPRSESRTSLSGQSTSSFSASLKKIR